MTKTNCIWNKDLEKFENCCIWAYIECKPEGCESYEPQLSREQIVEKKRCLECGDEEDRLS